MFLNSDGFFELEGDIGDVKLPTNLSESLRLRLASVAERDAPLHLLVKLAAVLGGAFTGPQLSTIWATLGDVGGGGDARGSVEEVITRGMKKRLLKYMAPSGSGGAASRRRSSAVHTKQEGQWAFWHLRIEDEVRAMVLRSESRALHRACAESLHGLVSETQLALHHEQAGLHFGAAQHFMAAAEELKSMGLVQDVVRTLENVLSNLGHAECEQTQAARRLELQARQPSRQPRLLD